MKRFFSLFLCLILLFSLIGCSTQQESVDVVPALSSEVSQSSESVVESSSSEVVSTTPETQETTQSIENQSEPAILPQPIIINTTKLDSNNLVFDLSWNGATSGVDYDLDLIAFMLDSDGLCYDSNGFIFYNNDISLDNAIKLSADIKTGESNLSETMTIDLSLVSPETNRIAIWICRFYEDDYDMSELDAAILKISNGDLELNSYSINEGVSFEVCELIREEDGWSLQDVNMISEYNLKDICISYGLIVD